LLYLEANNLASLPEHYLAMMTMQTKQQSTSHRAVFCSKTAAASNLISRFQKKRSKLISNGKIFKTKLFTLDLLQVPSDSVERGALTWHILSVVYKLR
jgi:hypothetical protein